MEKLKLIPHKFLFYIGFFVVFIFLTLSYWQLNRHQATNQFIYTEENQLILKIDEVNDIETNSYVKLQGAFILTDVYKLRSRVHNGVSGYHVVATYKHEQSTIYLTVNHGWIPLENSRFEVGTFRYEFDGFLLNYDLKSPVGQDDEIDSDFLFRIDKYFIEIDQNANRSRNYPDKQLPPIDLVNKYIHLTKNCGTGVECAVLNTGYKPPHLSYSFQWLFFAFCLSIVILKKNKII